MPEVDTSSAEYQGYPFDVHVYGRPNGFSYDLYIHFLGAKLPRVSSGDELFDSIASARSAARDRAGALIAQCIKSAVR